MPFLASPFPATGTGATPVAPVVPPATGVALVALPPLPTLPPVAALLFPATPFPAPTPFPANFPTFGFPVALVFLTPSAFLTGLGTALPAVPAAAVPAAAAVFFGFGFFGFAGLGVDVGCGAGGRADICARGES